ncbi:MAG: ABC transporter ATP-binding protein [Candidatus Velthaea sp.]
MNAIAVHDLSKSFGGHRVFDGLDFSVKRGEIVAVLGASGCGKSTLLRCIAGLEKPDGGTIDVAGEIGFVFQEPRLFPWLSVEKNVRFAARNDAERARVPEVLALVGLTNAAQLLPKQLSGGMAQRASLARTLVRNPSTILLDEPLAALDALRRIELRSAIAEIVAAAGATAVLVTHDVDEALAIADRVVVLQRATETVRAIEPARGLQLGARATLLSALGVSA